MNPMWAYCSYCWVRTYWTHKDGDVWVCDTCGHEARMPNKARELLAAWRKEA